MKGPKKYKNHLLLSSFMRAGYFFKFLLCAGMISYLSYSTGQNEIANNEKQNTKTDLAFLIYLYEDLTLENDFPEINVWKKNLSLKKCEPIFPFGIHKRNETFYITPLILLHNLALYQADRSPPQLNNIS